MGHYSKAKGYRGETEVLRLLEGIVNEVYQRRGVPPPELSRSPQGRDLIGIPWVAIEVKRHERDNPFNVSSWWEQTKEQAGGVREPILFYRMNNRPWNVRMFGFIGENEHRVRCPVDTSVEAFSLWFRLRLESMFK
jgi:hypothetical protein